MKYNHIKNGSIHIKISLATKKSEDFVYNQQNSSFSFLCDITNAYSELRLLCTSIIKPNEQ